MVLLIPFLTRSYANQKSAEYAHAADSAVLGGREPLRERGESSPGALGSFGAAPDIQSN